MEQHSPFPNKKELLAIAGILALALGLFFVFSAIQQKNAPYCVAHIIINGSEVQTIDLNQAPDQTIDLDPLWGVPAVLEIKEHQIRFASSNCPDQICVNGGFINKELQTLVCMPNRAVVAIDSAPTP